MELGPNQKKWIEAIRSGEYSQAKNYLRTEGGYCCLGVAVKVISGREPKIRGTGQLLGVYSSVRKALKLRGSSGELVSYIETGDWTRADSLAKLNDDGWTFDQIADYIEANPEDVFIESA